MSQFKSKQASKVWNYFKINNIDISKSNCNLCQDKVSRGGKDARTFGTTTMINHLRAKHPIQFQEYEIEHAANKKIKLDKQETCPGNQVNQKTLPFYIEKAKVFDINCSRHIEITKRVGEMMAVDMLPFSVVENGGFKRLLHELEPRYAVPSRIHFSRTVVPDMYSAVRKRLQHMVDEADCISFTSDVWTTTNNLNAFLSLTAHWIDEKWARRYVFLGLQCLEGSHTGELISDNLQTILLDWKITSNRRQGTLVRDNGANMKLAARLSGLDDLSCYIHTIQLVVEEGLKPTVQRSVGDAISIARSIVGHFRHSTKATETLTKIQASLDTPTTPFPQHRLIQDIQTRWNSTFYMLERLLEQKRALGIYAQEKAIPNLTPIQWTLIGNIVKTLRPFEQETRNASFSCATAGMIIPSVRMLSLFLKRPANPGDDFGIQTMRAEMLQDLTSRFFDIERNKLCVIATCLDPTSKLCFFSSDHIRENAKKWLKEEAEVEYRKSKPKPGAANISNPTQPAAVELITKPALYDLWQEIINTREQEKTSNLTTDVVEQEINRYFAEPLKCRPLPPEPPEDPVKYWNSSSKIFPNLAAVARRYLGTPPSSVDSERAFSTAGNICNDKRSSMSAKKTEMLLFLKQNLPILEFHY